MIGFPIWLHKEVARETNNYIKVLPYTQEQINLITDWVENVNPVLDDLNLEKAYKLTLDWNKHVLAKSYQSNQVAYSYKDGWNMVAIPFDSKHEHDLEIERELMQRENDIGHNYFTTITTEDAHVFEGDSIEEEKDYNVIFYSLRDPQNYPRATIEIGFRKDNPKNINIAQVYTNEELVKVVRNQYYSDYYHAQKDKIKEFFDYLKNKGYIFSTIEDTGSEKTKVEDLQDREWENEYGIPYHLYGIGGDEDTYFENLKEAYSLGFGGSQWYEGTAFKHANNIIIYASLRNELDKLEKPLDKLSDWAWDIWIQSDVESNLEHHYEDEPEKDDFILHPETKPGQKEFKDMPKSKPRFDKEGYEEAMQEWKENQKAYEEELASAEEYFEPYIFNNYVYKEFQEYKKAKEEIKPKSKKAMTTKIIKIAKDKEKTLSGEDAALYVKTLKQYLKDNPNIPEEFKSLIQDLPNPRKIRQDFSTNECKVLYETLEYLWKNIAKTELIPEEEIIKAPEKLQGCYWLMANGVLLKGLNHHNIIKNNTNLICSLLEIGGMTLQEYMASNPNDLIKFIIKSGGVRIFISNDGRWYCQMSPTTYGNWGKEKIQKMDFKKKVVKLIDLRVKYEGWKSGLTVIL